MKYVKYALLLLFLILGTKSHSQSSNRHKIPLQGGLVVYTEVVEERVSRDSLFTRAKNYLTTIFPNFSNVAKVDDRELGKISVRGSTIVVVNPKVINYQTLNYWLSVTVEVKEGRYKYTLDDFKIIKSPAPWQSIERMIEKNTKYGVLSTEKFDQENRRIIEGLKKYMSGADESW